MGTGIIIIFAVGFVLYWIGAVMEAESRNAVQSAQKNGPRATFNPTRELGDLQTKTKATAAMPAAEVASAQGRSRPS